MINLINNIFKQQDYIDKNNNYYYDINDKGIVCEKNSNYLKKLQKYAIENGLEYLQKGLKEPIRKMLQEYIIFNYGEKKHDVINSMINKVLDNMFGYGILQKYIDCKEITDIRVVKYNLIYVKRLGKWEKTNICFENEDEFLEYIRYCIIKNNSNINFDIPIVVVSDKKYNLRIEAGIVPINSISPNLVIRIHRKENLTLKDLKSKKMLDENSYKIIKNAIKSNSNIIISGKGGSGKTTLLKSVINNLPENIAITINEETSELFIENKNVIQREVLNNRFEDKKIDLEKLMKHSLVMSNDVIVVGELKGREMVNFLDAITTGHMGLATIHSNSASNTINRLVTLFKSDVSTYQYKEEFVREIFCNSIDYIIFMKEYQVCEIIKFENMKNNVRKYNLIYKRKENYDKNG